MRTTQKHNIAFCTISSLIFISANLSTSALAQESQKEFEKPSGYAVHSPWNLFAGIAGGMGGVSGNDFRDGPTGGQFVVSGLVSRETRQWVGDLGGSWIFSEVSGENSAGAPITIRTRAGSADFSPRYRIGERWSLGPVINLAFGTDTSFGPSVDENSVEPFAGIKAVYQINTLKLPLRLLTQVTTDLAIEDRQVYQGIVGIQIGFPVHFGGNGNMAAAETSDSLNTQAAAPVRVKLDEQRVYFGTNSAAIRPEAKKALRALGAYLEEHPEAWDKIEVAGHADQRGSHGYNQKLSEKRAMSVKKAMSAEDAPESKLFAKGYSFDRVLDPANTPQAWEKNRRVELMFNDVKDPKTILEIMQPVIKQGAGKKAE